MPHTTKNDSKSVLIKNSWVITSSPFTWNRLNPVIRSKWKNTDRSERVTTMSTNKYCLIFVNNYRMALPRFWSPSFYLDCIGLNIVDNIFRESFLNWFFYDLSYLRISRQMLFFIIIDVEQLLVSDWFFNILIELNFP